MEPKVAAVPPAPDTGRLDKAPPKAQPAPRAEPKPPEVTPDLAEMRLVIELDQGSGTYVYKTINRQTGEVVLQLPRDEVLRLRTESEYSAGSVVRTKA